MADKKEVQEFEQHLEESVQAMLDEGYNEEYDIIIGLNNRVIRLGLNADSYELLKELLKNELE